MMKKYLFNLMALLALVLVVAGCSKENDLTEADYKSNAEKVLGVTIDPNQDWMMSNDVTANITVNLGLDQSYTVAVYDKNPLYNDDVVYYCKETIEEGGTLTKTLTLPIATNTYYVAVFDSKYRRLVKPVTLEDNAINVSFGPVSATAMTRAMNRASETGTYARTANDYLNPTTARNSNGSWNLNTQSISVSEMKAYEAFTDDLIDAQGKIMLDGSTAWTSATYYVTQGFNPSNNETIEVKNGNFVVGQLVFEGSGDSANSSSAWAGFDHAKGVISRTAVSFTPSVDGKLTLAYEGKWAPFKWTDNGTPISLWGTTYDGTNGNKNDAAVLDNAQADHTYRICYNDGINFYGLKHEYSTTLPGDGKHFRVASGTEITKVFHVNGNSGVTNDVVIYVEGKMHLNGNTLNGPTIVVADGGEVVIDGNTGMSNAGRIVILPGGKLTGSSGTQFNVNNGAPCYNAGTIDYDGELNVNGSDFYNCGDITVDVLRNTSGGYFTNFGKVTARTNTGAADSYNSIVINGCYMYYTENAGIGTLTNLDNSRLEVGGVAQFNPATQTLYDYSMIKAGTLYLNSTTFSGPSGSGYAVIQTDRISVNQGADLGSNGNLYWDWNIGHLVDHNYQVTDNCTVDNGKTYYSYIKNLKLKYISESSSIVSIPAGDCTGAGYNDTGSSGQGSNNNTVDDDIPGAINVYTYAFEDTFMGDYDMNDVVIQAWENPDNSNEISIKLCCTGAANNLYVYLRTHGEDNAIFVGNEVHTVLGGTAGKFINTGDEGEKFQTRDPYITRMTKPKDFTFQTADFWIQSPQGEIHWLTTTGDAVLDNNVRGGAPYGVMIPHDWAWPKEWVPITEAYSKFADFANDKSSYSDWYEETPVAGKTYSKSN